MRGLIEPGGQPTDWTIHSPLIEVRSTTPAKPKARPYIAIRAGATRAESGIFMPAAREPCVCDASIAG
jgi:hypothetical protein